MDLNDFLRNRKTAAEEDKGAVKLPLAGHKRGHLGKDSDATAEAVTAKRVRRSGAVEGLDLQAAQTALAEERDSTSAQAQEQRVQADLLSEQAAARMVHRVLDYVLQVELGGRHNAAKGGAPPFVPTAAELAAERAMWTPAAGYTIHHVVPASSSNAGLRDASSQSAAPSLETLMSVTEKERVPEGIRLLRSSLQMCNVTSDLVGGVRSGMAPHLRTHVLDVLERGLRGEAWLRDDDATAATFFTALGKPTTPEKGPSSVLLFCDAAPSEDDTRGEVGESGASSLATPADGAAAGQGFSLTAFLKGEDSSSSTPSSDDDGEDGS